jgi:ribA/ribD-fused uncharacterized protein
MESPNLENYLSRCVVGQKRTSKNKQFVFLENDYAIKGPYTEGRLNNVINRSKILSEWKSPVAVLMIDRFDIPDGTFIRFPNIMKGYNLENELHEESFSDYKYNILKNPPVINIGECLRSKNTWIFPLMEDMILTLCHCYILKVGDMNIRNSLLDPNTKQFYVIDYDDNLSTEREDEIFYFNKLPAKAYDWYNNVKCHYNNVANRLKVLLDNDFVINNNLKDRVLKTINLLEKYGTIKIIPKVGLKLNIISPKIIPKTKLNIILPPKQTILLPKNPKLNIVTNNTDDIYFFYEGKYKELSNYYCTKSPCLFKIGDLEFKSSEHSYQFYKFHYDGANKDTLEYAELVRNSQTPNDSKLLGHQTERSGYQSRMNDNIKLYKDKAVRRLDFDDVKIDIMKYVIYHKFDQNVECRNILLSTGNKNIFENSQYDSFWGIGPDKNGQNHLGKLLVELRTQLKDKYPINLDKKGYMHWKGLMGGSTTYSNIKLDIAKSALQKYIRRNIEEKALLIAFELYRFTEIPEAKAAVSNMYNRLAIIANEDVGPANLNLVLEVTKLVESKNRDIGVLYQIVKLLSNSKKTRLPSHCWRSYSNPDGRKVSLELGLPIDTEFTSDDLLFITENKNCDLFAESDPEDIRPCLLTFWNRLIKKDFNAFTWCYFYLEASKDITLTPKRKKFINGNQRFNTGKADILLWKVLSKFLDVECHDILVESYYNFSENRPFIQNAIVIALYGLKYEKINIIADPNDNDHIDDMLNGRYKTLQIDDFVIDKHTRDGRSNGMTVNNFVDEGAYVANEDLNYHNDLLAKIYSVR